MKALKIVIIILVIILGIVLIPPLFMPSEMYVERTAVLKAHPEVIWDQVNCLEKWEGWDVWHQDTNLVGTYDGPECGVDAENSWTYKNTTDGGTQLIVESRPPEYIKTLLDFGKMGTADSEFFLEETEEGTKVTWNLRSDSPYPVGRWIQTLMVKSEVEKAYTEGLENLNELTKDMKLAEDWTTGEIDIVEITGANALTIKNECGMEEMSTAMGDSFGKIMGYIQQKGGELAGPPFTIWYKYDDPNKFIFDCGIPVASEVAGEEGIMSILTYTGKAVHVTHTGSYESTQYSWEALMKYIEENQLEMNGDPWEVYITDPMTEPDPGKWITELYFPIK